MLDSSQKRQELATKKSYEGRMKKEQRWRVKENEGRNHQYWPAREEVNYSNVWDNKYAVHYGIRLVVRSLTDPQSQILDPGPYLQLVTD